jgi:S-adenosylmethionine:tRNA ribosyltransferase-isomerase
VKLEWDEDLSFSEVLEKVGKIPLPPYMKRKSTKDDSIRYQTVYAKNEGSVAAPTAGLHFTDKVFESLKSKNIKSEFVSLHVGAGTFKPVSTSSIAEHEMHIEKIIIKKSFIQNLKTHLPKNIIAVGTTSCRSLESMFWFGVQLIQNPIVSEFDIKQWDPYKLADFAEDISLKQSLEAILEYLEKNNLLELKGQTQLMIIPNYKFRVIDKLITNFHQPKSTLLLLVSAFYGDKWKQAYNYALENDFRFLSYGDSCLFSKKRQK